LFLPVTTPLLSTVAIEVLLLVHFKFLLYALLGEIDLFTVIVSAEFTVVFPESDI